MKQETEKICVYCDNEDVGKNNPVKIWEATGEMVCKECRIDLLDQEFEEEFATPKPEVPKVLEEDLITF